MHAWRGLSRGFRPATALRRCLLAHARPSAPHTGPPAIRCQSAAKHAGAKEQSRGGGRSKAKGAGQGAAAAAGAAKRAGAGQDATWRLYGVRVAADVDPGKDDFSAHPELLRAVCRRLGLKHWDASRLPLDAVHLVRKSFDARPPRRRAAAAAGAEKSWAYVVDVPGKLLQAAGVTRLREAPGQLERLAAGDAMPAATPTVGAQSMAASPAAAEPEPALAAEQLAGAGQGAVSGKDPVVVVGSGPAGLFCALALAEAGVKVVVLEQGQPVEVRGRDIGALFVRHKLNPKSNICYGEGGAGTYSDGKLATRIGRNSDPVRRVLNAFHQFGAPESILVAGKPHLGTDRLVRMLKLFREHLIARGAEVRFSATVEDLLMQGGRLVGVRLADGTELRASRVVLAVGHSARDMYRCLARHDVAITPKPFAMGFRIEHPQALIDRLQYGEEDAAEVQRGKGRYPVADYRLAAEINLAELPPDQGPPVWDTPDAWYTPLLPPGGADAAGAAGCRGVYSFCMCPGGQIVPTSTSEQELCINGMSFSKRNSVWANSALVVTVAPADWEHLLPEHGPLAGMALQQLVEREAAQRGGGGFAAPAQRVDHFLEGRPSAQQDLPTSSYRLGVRAAPLHDFYPPHMTAAFRAALERWDRTMPGFAGPEGLLHAAETRTSAPLRLDRGEDLQSLSLAGLYPCGEGAGYAGGIVSAAVDGLRVGTVIAAEVTGVVQPGQAADYRVPMGY